MTARASATCAPSRAGSPGPGERIDAVDVRRQHVRGGRGVREDPDAGAAVAHRSDDVVLQTEVDDPDPRPGVPGGLELGDGRRRHLADEVLVLPARDGPGRRLGCGHVDIARGGHDPAQAAVGAQVAREGAGVDTGDGRDPRIAQERRELARAVQHRGRGVGHDECPQPRADRLVVIGQAAVVADQGVRHDHDLARVRGVGADLLVAGLARVDDEVAAGGDRGSEGDAREHRTVLEGQQGRSEVPDPWVDDRARARRRWDDHEPADTTNPPAPRARWARTCEDI